MDPFGYTPDQYSAFWVGAQAVVLAVTLFYIARQVREAHRPFVSVDVIPGWLMYLSIRNVGQTMARNVRVRFDPPLTSTQDVKVWERSTLLNEGIPSLAPGREYRWFFDNFPARVNSDLPRRYDIFLDYDNARGKRVARGEHIVIDLNAFLGTSPPPKGLPQLVTAIEEIRKELHKWSDGISGLEVHTVDQQTMEGRRVRPRRIAEFHQTRASAGMVSAVRDWFDDWQNRTGWYRRDKVEERLRRRRRRRNP